jgi:hypothetical protein
MEGTINPTEVAPHVLTALDNCEYTLDKDSVMSGIRAVVNDGGVFAAILEEAVAILDNVEGPTFAERQTRAYLKALYNDLPDIDTGLYESERTRSAYYA